MPFFDPQLIPSHEVALGCHLRTPYGDNLLLSYLQMDSGAEIPSHEHPQEQGGVVIAGQLRLTIGDETRTIGPGEMYIIPGGVPHRAVAVDGPVTVLDVFSPVREDYANIFDAATRRQ